MKMLALLLLAGSLPAAAPSTETAAPDDCYRYGVLLDPEAPLEARQLHLARLRTAAGNDGVSAQHVLGTLFRLGADHPARLLERDDDQARHWLGKAARGGRLFAMAALAEMDLADGRPMDAMVWSQLMVLYARRYPPEGATRAPEYAADLIYRAYDALTSADAKAPRQRQSQALLRAFKQATDAEILKNVNAFLATEGPAIDAAFRERALAKEQPKVEDPNCPALYDPGRWPLEVVRNAPGANVVYTRAPAGMRRAGYGFFHLTVAPDGSVSRVLLVDALPNAEYGAGLQPEVEKLRFNAIEAAPARDALLPMTYSTGAVKLTN